MPIMEGTPRLKTLTAEYDFAVDGGAISTITLRGGAGDAQGNELPNGSVVEGGYIEVLTGFTTGTGATASLDSEAAGDLQAAAVVSGAPWSTTGRKSITPAFTGATTVKTSAKRNLTLTVATGTITAGKARFVVFYR